MIRFDSTGDHLRNPLSAVCPARRGDRLSWVSKAVCQCLLSPSFKQGRFWASYDVSCEPKAILGTATHHSRLPILLAACNLCRFYSRRQPRGLQIVCCAHSAVLWPEMVADSWQWHRSTRHVDHEDQVPTHLRVQQKETPTHSDRQSRRDSNISGRPPLVGCIPEYQCRRYWRRYEHVPAMSHQGFWPRCGAKHSIGVRYARRFRTRVIRCIASDVTWR